MPHALPSPTPASPRLPALTLAVTLGLAAMSDTSMAGVAVLDRGLTAADAKSSGLHLVQAQQDPSARAREQAYIARLEEEIRRLTGRIEQLEFQQRNVDKRFDQLVEDLDQRLRGLQGGGDPAAGGTDGERQQAEQALNELAESSDQQPPTEEGQLGSIPESAVAGLPKPDPSAVAAPETSSLTAEQQYENAVQLLQAGDYQGAQGGLEVFLDLNGDHQLASNAAYWLAETHYVRQNYSAAAATFARNYRTYGQDSAKAIDNLLKLGMSLTSLGDQENACLTFDKLAEVFPSQPAHIQQALSRERARANCG